MIKKNINFYLNLPWTYTIETAHEQEKQFYILHVNELPGICTDEPTAQEAMELIKEPMTAVFRLYLKNDEIIPEPINL